MESKSTVKAPKKWTWRKPKGKPKRPLSAYNIFFKEMRPKILAQPSVVGFSRLAQVVAANWKNLDSVSKRPYEEMARQAMTRYRAELSVWERNQVKPGPVASATSSLPDDVVDPTALELPPLELSTSDMARFDPDMLPTAYPLPPSSFMDLNLYPPPPLPDPFTRYLPPTIHDASYATMDPLEPLPAFDTPRVGYSSSGAGAPTHSQHWPGEADCALTLASISTQLLEPSNNTP